MVAPSLRFKGVQSLTESQDPEMQKVTGKTDPVEVMAALREGKNNFK